MPAAQEAFSSVGSQIFIAKGAPTTLTAAGYASQNWIEIGEVDDIGEYGAESSILKRTPLASNITQKRKGSRDYGDIALQMAMVPGDAGHVALLEASDSNDLYSIKVQFQDGTIDYFRALISSYKKKIGGSEAMTMASTSLAITSATTTVYPA